MMPLRRSSWRKTGLVLVLFAGYAESVVLSSPQHQTGLDRSFDDSNSVDHQSGTFDCRLVPDAAESKLAAIVGIDPKPQGKSFRILALYFKLADDQFELGRLTKEWPHTQAAPDWKGQFLIDAPFDSSTYEEKLAEKPGSLTAYYYLMSGGNLWLYGDEVVYSGHPLYYERGDSLREQYENFCKNNDRILQWLADHYDLSKLDNRNRGEVDLILMLNRARPKFGYTGLGGLELYQGRILDANNIAITPASGTYQTDCYLFFDTRALVAHEVGHQLGFWHLETLPSWALMSGCPTMSAFEKHQLGWLDYVVIDKTTLGVTLPRLTQTNTAIKIPVRNSNAYFVVENRGYSEPFEPYPRLAGTGLLVYSVYRWNEIGEPVPYIIPADGRVTLLTRLGGSVVVQFHQSDNTDLFGNYSHDELTPFTDPSTDLFNKGATGIAIKNIRKSGEDFIFDVYYDYTDNDRRPNAPLRFGLRNYPNPFNHRTKIYYELEMDSHVTLEVFDVAGRRIETLVDQSQRKWNYAIDFLGMYYPSGVYFYVLKTNRGQQAGKMILLNDIN